VRCAAVWVGLVAALLLAPAARAATITVTTNADSGSGACTLRDAINAANTNAVAGACAQGNAGPVVDIIDFSPSVASPIMLISALPNLTSDMAITGPGSGQLTVSGQDTVRPFNVLSAHTDSISGLTISDGFCGNVCGGGGGAILNAGTLTLTDVTVTSSSATDTVGPNSFPEGGGIRNSTAGTLHLILSTVSANSAIAGGVTAQTAPTGGGIANFGVLTLDRSTVSGNDATATADPGATTNAIGGGISNSKQLTVTQSTISGNTVNATAGTANSADGGGIFQGTIADATITLDRATLTGNTASGDGTPKGGAILAGGFTGSALTVTSSTITGNTAPLYANVQIGTANTFIKNTIVSNPLGGGTNCNTTNSGSQGFNIDDGMSCGFTQPGDEPGTDPMLDPTLAGNGGPTQTLALLTGSPAIDRGLSSGETVDQRGLSRPSDFASIPNAAGGDGTDVGAFEVQAPRQPPGTTPDTLSPETSLNARIRKRKRKAIFNFGSSETGSSFLCKLDKAAFAPCIPPAVYRHLRLGKHTFMVKSIDPAGNADPFPASFKFRLRR
jgi:hypothetical protein